MKEILNSLVGSMVHIEMNSGSVSVNTDADYYDYGNYSIIEVTSEYMRTISNRDNRINYWALAKVVQVEIKS